MRRIADLLIKIGADSYEFKQKSREVEQGLEQLSRKLTSIGKTMSLAVTTPLVALGVVAVQAFDGAERAAAKVRTAVEQTGEIIMPVVQDIAHAVNRVVLALQQMSPHWKKFIVTAAAVAAAIGPVLLALGGIVKVLPMLKAGFALLVAPVKTVMAAVKALTVTIASNPIGLLLRRL